MLAEALVYIGTVTSAGSEGIYLSRLDLETGGLSEPILAATASHPGFLTTDPDNRFLYCTGKPARKGKPFSAISAFALNPETAALTPLNSQSVEDSTFCHISTTLGGRVLLAADYGKGRAASFPLAANGHIGAASSVITYDVANAAVPNRQQHPHVHSINADVAGRFVFVCDFSADSVRSYALDPKTLELELVSSASTAAGSGPRHLTCHPNGRWVYVINELNGTITGYDVDPSTGALEEKQTVPTLPADFQEKNTTAEIAFSPDLRFLYGSNRGHDSIACYRVDSESGMLKQEAIVSTQGEHPRNFSIDATGRFMLVSNRDTDNVVVFRLDSETGAPVYTGHQLGLSKPMAIQIIHPD